MKNPGIYILTSPSGKQYVGRDSNLPRRVKTHFRKRSPNCRAIHDAIKKYGADAFHVEIIRYPGISEESLNAIEKWKIKQLQTMSPKGYNLTDGGEGCIPSEETRIKKSEITLRHIANGTHNFVGDRHPTRKHVADGTHHFLGGEIQRQRVANGTHHFLDSDFQRRNAQKRVDAGTHNFLSENNPSHKRVEDGTHNFLGNKNPVHRRVADGTHNFLGDKNPSHKRIADGTHNLLGKNNPSHKRVEDGTHNFLGRSNSVAANLAQRKYKIVYQYAVMIPKCYWHALNSVYLHRKLTREGFFDKDIPDTSNAEQEYLL